MNNLGHLSDLNLKEVAFGNPLQVPQRARDDAFRELNRRELERLDREAANMQVWEEMNEWAESGSSQSECVDCGTEIEYKPESNDRCVRCGGICLSCYKDLEPGEAIQCEECFPSCILCGADLDDGDGLTCPDC